MNRTLALLTILLLAGCGKRSSTSAAVSTGNTRPPFPVESDIPPAPAILGSRDWPWSTNEYSLLVEELAMGPASQFSSTAELPGPVVATAARFAAWNDLTCLPPNLTRLAYRSNTVYRCLWVWGTTRPSEYHYLDIDAEGKRLDCNAVSR